MSPPRSRRCAASSTPTPTLRFKLDPTNDWDDELIAALVETGAVDSLDLKGFYKGTVVDVETDPELYAKLIEAFPDAWLEDPDVNDETRPILEPVRDRLTWDAPIHSIADIEALPWAPRDGQHQALADRRPARPLRRPTTTAPSTASAPTAAASGSSASAAARSRYLASLFHPDTPNDTAPRGYNDAEPPPGLPSSPLEPQLDARPASAGPELTR